jgi:hypothetical protein
MIETLTRDPTITITLTETERAVLMEALAGLRADCATLLRDISAYRRMAGKDSYAERDLALADAMMTKIAETVTLEFTLFPRAENNDDDDDSSNG